MTQYTQCEMDYITIDGFIPGQSYPDQFKALMLSRFNDGWELKTTMPQLSGTGRQTGMILVWLMPKPKTRSKA